MNNIKNYALLICNLQTKTIHNLVYKDKVINNVNKLSYMKKYIPSIKLGIIGEFIPEKFGYTHPAINKENIDFLDKCNENYSMVNNYLIHELSKHNISNIILSGMDTQWAIKNTAKDLKDLDYNVYIPLDAIGNNLQDHHNISNIVKLEKMKVNITKTDILIKKILNDNSKYDIAIQKYKEMIKNNNIN